MGRCAEPGKNPQVRARHRCTDSGQDGVHRTRFAVSIISESFIPVLPRTSLGGAVRHVSTHPEGDRHCRAGSRWTSVYGDRLNGIVTSCILILDRCRSILNRCDLVFTRYTLVFTRCTFIFGRCALVFTRCGFIFHRCTLGFDRWEFIFLRRTFMFKRRRLPSGRCAVRLHPCTPLSPVRAQERTSSTAVART